jgi:hypothetical protein
LRSVNWHGWDAPIRDAVRFVGVVHRQRHTGRRFDALYREWKRTRDEDALRQLHAAISDQMAVT